MSENLIINVPEERTISIVTVEIQTLQKQAQQVVLGYAIEIGKRLTEAKSMLPHGAWGDWLRDEVHYSKSTANNFMRIFDAYGADQQSMFGAEAKSQTLGNLSYTKALRLLAIPEEEREEFAEANNVEDISTRELDRLIKERDEARAALQETKERAEIIEGTLEAAKAAQETLQKALNNQKQEMEDKLAAAQKELNAQTAKLSEAGAKAEKAAAADMAEKVKAAEEKQREAERAAKDAAEDLEKAKREKEALEKKLALSDENTILLNAEFNRLQEIFNRCHGYLMKIEAGSPEMAEKLRGAMRSILDSMKERV